MFLYVRPTSLADNLINLEYLIGGVQVKGIFNRLQCLLVLVGLIFGLWGQSLSVQAQDVAFDITRLNIDGQITAEGKVQMNLVYDYDVSFMNGALFEVDYGESRIGNYQAGIIDSKTEEFVPFEQNYTATAETFSVNDNGSSLEFRLYYPAEDEQVRFAISYTLDGLVTNYLDTAEYYQMLVSPVASDGYSVSARIELPGAIEETNRFRTWAYGSPRGQIYPRIEGEQAYIEVDVPQLDPGEFVEVRSLFPESLTPNNTKFVESEHFQEVVEVEQAQVEADQAKYQEHNQHRSVAIGLMALLGVFTLFWAYRFYFQEKKRQNPHPVHVPEHLYHLPDDLTPAVMASAVLRSEANADDLVATILDLARKGFIELKEVEREEQGRLSRGETKTILLSKRSDAPAEETLMNHERYALQYLFADQREEISLESLEAELKASSTFAKEQEQLWSRFKDYAAIRGQMVRGGLNEGRRKSKVWAWLAFVGTIIFGVIAIALVQSLSLKDLQTERIVMIVTIVVWCLAILATILLIYLAYQRPIVSEQEDKMRKEWHAFARMLEDIGQFEMREVASLALWEAYLVYAVSLGVADKVLEEMRAVYAVEELETLTLPGDFYTHPYLITHVMRQSVHESVQATQPPPVVKNNGFSGSNTGGFGGGFSSGGGGASGGSSAGGF